MMRLQAIVLAQNERAVLTGLGQLKAVHLTRMQSGPDTAPLAPIDCAGKLVQYDHVRARIQELRKSLEIPAMLKEPRSAETTLGLAEEKLYSLEQRSAALLKHRQHLIQRQKELAGISEQVSPYRGLEIPLSGLDEFSFLHFVTGSLPAENLERLGSQVGDNVALLPASQQKGQQSLFAVTTRQGWPALERTLQQTGFQYETLPVVQGVTVDRLSEETQREQEQLTTELERLNGRLQSMATEFALPLAEIEGFADREWRLLDASQKFPRTETTILITGWVPAGEVVEVEHRMGEITSGRYVLRTSYPQPSAEEEAPVLLKHSRLLRPFEMLVSTYGLPGYQELEPTLFVALSYMVMFGMMFGDAGHGMVLAVCGLVALLAGRSRNARDLGVLLLFGGASSIIFGVVYGSYFGIEAFKKYALWHDPLEGDPMQLMYIAIGMGIIMISLGLILNVINRFRRGDIIGGFLDKFGLVGLLFYWGTLFLLVNGSLIRSWGLMGTSVILFLVVPIVGWSLKEPIEHLLSHGTREDSEPGNGVVGALMESCVGAFEAVLSYLANTISFVRLAAYAMSHAALLFAAFMLAAQLREFPYGGSLWSLLVIILGNIIAIILEGVIASVQALRLEYYEFFGKFYSGTGQPFEPFRLAPDGKDQVG
jgi:V/A-type H+/Na+-transporting ATPase subunit I